MDVAALAPTRNLERLCGFMALLKVDAKPARVGALRFEARQGETVEAFGYPLSQVLATSSSFPKFESYQAALSSL